MALIFLLLAWTAVSAAAETMEETTARADLLVQNGRFPEAEAAYRDALRMDPGNRKSMLGLGRVLLFRNAIEESEAWLKKAIGLDGADRTAQGLLAENLYRRGEFGQAAEILEALGARAKAAKYRRLAEKPAYAVESRMDRTVVPFLQTDPLPLVCMRIHGVEAYFLIDTGAMEIALNADFADRLGLERLGEQAATYAGGLQARIWHSVAENVEIGDFTVRNVPVTINERNGTGLPGFVRPISGIIGTAFLYRFLFTLDYPGGALILEKPSRKKTEEPRDGIRVPFWLCGDHYIMAWGSVNDVPGLLFIDTGMAGGGFSVSENMLKEARIALSEAAGTGIGGGGAVQVRRIQADLALADAREAGVAGFYGVMPAGMNAALGFRLDGIISHDFFRPYRCAFDFRSMTLTMVKDEAG